MFLSVCGCVISRTELYRVIANREEPECQRERKGGGDYWTLCLLVHLEGTFWSKGKKHIIRPTEQAVHVVSLQLQAAIIPAVLRGFLFIRSFLSLWYSLKDDGDHHYGDKGW